MPPKKKPIKPKKKPKKTKPKTTTKQKQSQKQVVNQIVKVYLDERNKSKRTRRTPQKRNVSSGRQNISVSPVFSSPLNEMYSYRQPNNSNPITDLLNKINAVANKTTGQGNRLGSIQEEAKSPTGEQIADMYENKIIQGNPLVEPKPIQEKFPSLDPHFTPEPIEEIVGVEETKGGEPDEEPDEEPAENVEEIVGDMLGEIVTTIERRDLPDPTSDLSREEQESTIRLYDESRPPGRQGKRPTTIKGFLRGIKRYQKERNDFLEMASNIGDDGD